MFVGEFEHALDSKNRLVIPAKFRAFITDPQDRKGFFVIVNPVAGARCLLLYTMAGWKRVARQLRLQADQSDDPARYLRFYASRGEFAPVDAQHRIVISQKLLGYAGLKKDVLMVGNIDSVEVWDAVEYRAAIESLDEEIQDRSRALWPKPE